MKTNRRPHLARRLGAVGMIGALLLSACGGPQSEVADVDVADVETLVEQAEEEGSLLLYSAPDPALNDALVAAFEAEYDIDVEVLHLATGPLVQRYSAEASSNQVVADLLLVAGGGVFSAQPDWFQTIDETQIPGIVDYPEEAVGERYMTGMLFPYAVVYNTDAVSGGDIPETWEDLVDPKYSGTIALTDPSVSPSYAAWLDAVGERFGLDYLKKLGEQNVEVVQSATPGAQQVAAGANDLNFPTFPVNGAAVMDTGAPVDYVVMNDPPIVLPVNLGISSRAPHPYAARLFAHWLTTPAAHEAACGATAIASPLSTEGEIADCLPLAEDWTPSPDTVSEERMNELLDALNIDG